MGRTPHSGATICRLASFRFGNIMLLTVKNEFCVASKVREIPVWKVRLGRAQAVRL
jgi:hypothetical protein